MNRGTFAQEYIDELDSYLKKEINSDNRNFIYAAFLAGMKKEREIQLPRIERLKLKAIEINKTK